MNEGKKENINLEKDYFFNLLNNFSNIKIITVKNFNEEIFFDFNKKILKIPKSLTPKQIKKIINILDKYTNYDLGITAKKRMELEKAKLKISALRTNLERDLLREALYEQGKKQVLETMQAPGYSSFLGFGGKLLKDEIGLDKLSKNFNSLTLEEQKKELIKILNILAKYPVADTNNNDGGIPMRFIENQKLYCVGFSYLSDIIFEKLKVKHYVATGILNRNRWMPHSVSVIKLKNKYFIFDPTDTTFPLEEVHVKNGIIDLRKKENSFYEGYIFTLGDPEKEILVQNIRNISFNKNYSEAKKMLNYALKLSPNNILLIKELLEFYPDNKVLKRKLKRILYNYRGYKKRKRRRYHHKHR